jgi:hypothetical protein
MTANSPDKAERLAAALRENLKRRKARTRALDVAGPPVKGPMLLTAESEADRSERTVEAER